VVSAVLQRIGVVGKCRTDQRCPDPDAPGVWPNYRALLGAAEPRIREGDPAIALLGRTHAAYLGWLGEPRLLDEMRARDVARVARWLSSGGLRTDWVLASASSQFAPVRSRDFWGWDGPLQVDAPFTRRAWTDGIQPLLQGLRGIAPDARDVETTLRRFQGDYQLEAMRQWGQFLASFPKEERVLGGRRGARDLAVRSLEAESPYRRVVDAAATNVQAIAGAASAEEVPAWAATLMRYATLKTKAADARALGKQKGDEAKAKYTDADRQAFARLTAYEEALDQLKGELGGGDKAYKSVQKVFEEGESTERSTHPLHRALWNVQVLRATIGTQQGDDRAVWSLLTRPVELVWRVMLDEAAQHAQGQWEALIPGLAGLTPGLQAAKIIEFANGPAAIFLERSRDRYVLRRFLGVAAPLSPAFVDFISKIRWIPPDRLERIDPPQLMVVAS
jgi:hypothetical protein